MSNIVAKFGGSSLADASQIRKVLAIVKSDASRRAIVVSAPGKRKSDDKKITDLFYEWQKSVSLGHGAKEIQEIVSGRFTAIVKDLGLSLDIKGELEKITRDIAGGASADYAASRGEYLCGKIVAEALGYEFADPATCISFDAEGRHKETDEKLREIIGGRNVVIPGFYGSMPDGSIKTFSRGGSDLTGAIVARALKADLYENWTDVSGLLMADPRIVENPKRIAVVTYKELRELAYMGASVFHEDAMFPVQEAGIPTHILNTNEPAEHGTAIVSERELKKGEPVIAGVAGGKSFAIISVEKSMMNQEVGFVRKILTVLEENKVSWEHMPSGIDIINIVVNEKELEGKSERIVEEIQKACAPDIIEIFPHMAMLAIVGLGIVNTPGVAAQVFKAVADTGTNIHAINMSTSEMSIIIGVKNEDCDNAIRAIYNLFVK
ncbi:MAG TPA: aspartate kinase [Candidatus Paceibacterota bacterium]|nr:aspartate kinase [Candidatus Paceibacterota bacterium]